MMIITNHFIPKRYAAYTIGFVILIRPEHKNNFALIEHEKQHVKQFYRSFGWNGLFYISSKSYRLHAEAEGYAVQYVRNGRKEQDLSYYSNFLANNYRLNKTADQCREAILAAVARL